MKLRCSLNIFGALALSALAVACARPEPPEARFDAAIEALSAYIEHEMEDKQIPGLSIALVDGDEIVWAEGFGMADVDAGIEASAETVYRVGSLSKLFTDIGLMQLVEQGKVDLDAPVQAYLPDFEVENPFDRPITLRQLMTHRSGLVREPPAGHYFDATSPSIAETVASLHGSRLVYEPESRTKYSNAGITVVGHALETVVGEPFAHYLKGALLEPMGLMSSAFTPEPRLRQRLAKAWMWSYDGRRFPAATFEFGMAPAGSLYSTVLDLGQFMRVLFTGGQGPGGQLLQPETLEEMFTPQFVPEDQAHGFGLGFFVDDFDGHRSVGHDGAVYGFATSLTALPDQQLGAVAVANLDVVNSVTDRVITTALEMMLAIKEGRELPRSKPTERVDAKLAARLEGHYAHEERLLELVRRGDELYLSGIRTWARVRAAGEHLALDDRLHDGPWIQILDDGSLQIGERVYAPVEASKPGRAPDHFRGLIGEYGWDHSVLFVYERGGQLYALIEWTEIDPLTEVSRDVYAFPTTGGMYHGEQLVFRRDAQGRAYEVEVAGLLFPRREIQGESVATFSIEPSHPVEELRREALATEPPAEEGDFLATDLVEITSLDPTVRLDIRYASDNNFMGTTFYRQPRAFLQRSAAEAAVRVHRSLAKHGYGLLVHDAYRPWFVTKMFWDATPEEHKRFVADPSEGSRHNRGCAVDLTLYDVATGQPVQMVGLYDEFSERSKPDYIGGTSLQRWHRDLLRDAMESEGFSVYEHEWWHFDYAGWEQYRIGNQVFEQILDEQQ